jgi:putative transposase
VKTASEFFSIIPDSLAKAGKRVFSRIIFLNGQASSQKYPVRLRLITFKDEETGKIYLFITNNFQLTAIAAICRQRRQIKLFFKWIKQNLKIKTFLGTSKNAVMAQADMSPTTRWQRCRVHKTANALDKYAYPYSSTTERQI